MGPPPPVLAAPTVDEALRLPSSPMRSCGPLRQDMGHAGRDVVDDLMMVELAASLPIIQIAGAPRMGPRSTVHAGPWGTKPLGCHLHLCLAVGRYTLMGQLRIFLGIMA